MIRLVRLFTAADGQSHVQESTLDLHPLDADSASGWLHAESVRFQQSPPGSQLPWHDAPQRQYVVTLTGTLEFTTRDGRTFRLGPGDVLLAEDTAGGGHRWRLIDHRPWTRVYIKLA